MPDENLLYNDPNLTLMGTTIEGITNNTGAIFELTASESMTAGGGQADANPTDGAFNSIMINAQSPLVTFTTLLACVPFQRTTGISLLARELLLL